MGEEQHERKITYEGSMEEITGQMKAKMHCCLIYSSGEEWADAVTAYIKTGLEMGDKCIYPGEPGLSERVREASRQAGFNFDRYIESGQLSFVCGSSSSTEEGFRCFTDVLEAALEEGYSQVRVTHENDWLYCAEPVKSEIFSAEALVCEKYIDTYPLVSLCQYDARKYDAPFLKKVLLSHPWVIRDGCLYRNDFFLSPDKRRSVDFDTYELDCLFRAMEGDRRAADLMAGNRGKYEALFDQSLSAVYVHDRDGRIVDVNEEGCRQLGYSREELLELSVFDILARVEGPFDDLALEVKRQWQGWVPGERHVFSTFHTRKDGNVFPVRVASGLISFGREKLFLSQVEDISVQADQREMLERISWMLGDAHKESYESILRDTAQPYGNLPEPEGPAVISRSIKKEILAEIAADYLGMLGTSSAIFEKNGEYAMQVYTSGWCRLLNNASRNLCPTDDNREALECKRWLCHEMCWSRAARPSIETGRITDRPCPGGLRLYAVPIRAFGDVIGSITMGYGDPPCELNELADIAERYDLDRELLADTGSAYNLRPPFIVDMAKKRLQGSARLIGLLVEQREAEEKLRRSHEELSALNKISTSLRRAETLEEIMPLILDETLQALNCEAGAICLCNARADGLQMSVTRGWFDELKHIRLGNGEGVAGKVFADREIHISDCFADDPHFKHKDMVPPGWGGACLPLKAAEETVGTLFVSWKTPHNLSAEEADLLTSVASMAGSAIHRIRLHGETLGLLELVANANLELTRSYEKTIEGWARTLELRDSETEGHSQRVAAMTVRLARAMGLEEEEIDHIRRGALLHDVGKVGISDSILLKKGKLDEGEWELMKQHPELAYELLKPIEYLEPALAIPLCHHERYDGSGYPQGLKGEEIPLEARIFAVIDVFDALTSDRPYRAAWSRKDALEYIRESAGSHFDPGVVKVFLKLYEK